MIMKIITHAMCITTLIDSYKYKLINNLINLSIFYNKHATLIDLHILVKGHNVHIDEIYTYCHYELCTVTYTVVINAK